MRKFLAGMAMILLSIFCGIQVHAAVCEAQAGSACFYIAPDGNDANPGTFEAPFKTFQSALVKVNPGDVIYARGGTYGKDNAMLQYR
jgi:hypothetical protein